MKQSGDGNRGGDKHATGGRSKPFLMLSIGLHQIYCKQMDRGGSSARNRSKTVLCPTAKPGTRSGSKQRPCMFPDVIIPIGGFESNHDGV
jgi:hypothetical protein